LAGFRGGSRLRVEQMPGGDALTTPDQYLIVLNGIKHALIGQWFTNMDTLDAPRLRWDRHQNHRGLLADDAHQPPTGGALAQSS